MRAISRGLLPGGVALAMMVASPLIAEAGGKPQKVEKRIEVVVRDDGTQEGIERQVSPEGDHAFAFAPFGSVGGRLGVGLEDVTNEDVSRSKLDSERGAVVRSVEDKTAAAQAGLVRGDVIVRFEGEVVRSAAALARMVRETPPGRTVALEVMRKGALQTLSATLGESRGGFEGLLPQAGAGPRALRPPVPPLRPVPPGAEDHVLRWESREGADSGDSDEPMVRILNSAEPPRLGVRLLDVEGQLASYFELPGGQGVLVTSVEADSAAAKAGVRAGDIILKLDGEAVASAAELRRVVRKADGGKPLPLSVWRGGKAAELSVTLPETGRRARRPAARI